MHIETSYDTLEQRLQPPADAKTSVMLNSVGNGMMLGAGPFIIAKTVEGLTDWKMTKPWYWGEALLTVAGIAWGYHSGQKEFKALEDYRHALSSEVLKLHSQINDNSTQIKSWSDRVRKPESAELQATTELTR